MSILMNRLVILSALGMSSGLFAVAEPETELETQPRYAPPPPPPPPPPPLLTPEQIKAQEKRARKAAKWAKQKVNSEPRVVKIKILFTQSDVAGLTARGFPQKLTATPLPEEASRDRA